VRRSLTKGTFDKGATKRDRRRLVVTMSRARLDLYVFGHWDTMIACEELAPLLLAMVDLTQRMAQQRFSLPSLSLPPLLPINSLCLDDHD